MPARSALQRGNGGTAAPMREEKPCSDAFNA